MILVLGVAGSGKSTQSQLLANKGNRRWLSMGQLLRNQMHGNLLGKMNSGKLLSDEQVQPVLLQALTNLNGQKVVLDGFPRSPSQADWLTDTTKHLQDDIELVIHLRADENTVVDRLLKRGRNDDIMVAINERLTEYQVVIKPVIDLFKQNGVPVIDINANQTPDAVHEDIINAINNLGIKV
jgi:adenylate kinase